MKWNRNFRAQYPRYPSAISPRPRRYYADSLGFSVDWVAEADGIAGVSKGQCRMFLTNHAFREQRGNAAPVLVWINLKSKEEVNALHTLWSGGDAKIISQPESQPWMLHEFTVADLDGNLFRVFYDFSRDV